MRTLELNDACFTADDHFFHDNIIKHCKRPFKNAFEMNEVLVENWNSVVKPNGAVINAGDFAMKCSIKDLSKIIYRLNGTIYFVEGNHDEKGMLAWIKANPSQTKVKLLPRYETVMVNGQYIFINHYAQRSWWHDLRGNWHVFGHTHDELGPFGKSCDVGVDAWNFTPVTFEQLKDFMDKRPIGPHPGFKGYVPGKD